MLSAFPHEPDALSFCSKLAPQAVCARCQRSIVPSCQQVAACLVHRCMPASSSWPRPQDVAILPIVRRASARRRAAHRPAAPPRCGFSAPRRVGRGPARCRRSCPSSRRARARRRAAHRPAAAPRCGFSAPRRVGRGPARCRRFCPSSRRASARRRAAHRPAAASSLRIFSASSSWPRACKMSAILPIVTARERTSPSRS